MPGVVEVCVHGSPSELGLTTPSLRRQYRVIVEGQGNFSGNLPCIFFFFPLNFPSCFQMRMEAKLQLGCYLWYRKGPEPVSVYHRLTTLVLQSNSVPLFRILNCKLCPLQVCFVNLRSCERACGVRYKGR